MILADWRPSFGGTGIPNLELGWSLEPANRPTAESLYKAMDAYVVGKEGGGFTTSVYS